MNVLITYFEPFGGESLNSAMEAARLLPEEHEGHHVFKRQLPVSFERAPIEAMRQIGLLQPDLVIALGQAAGRASINLERVAVNLAKATTADNDGQKPQGRRIADDGPDAHFTSIPVDSLSERLRSEGHPCFVSNSAGTYVCNALFYSLLHEYPHLPIGFIHIPLTPAQAVARTSATPSMSPQTASAAILAAIRMLLA